MYNKRNPLPGGGPWRILSNCPSPSHNILYRVRHGPVHLRCICPRALAIQEEWLVKQRNRFRDRYQERQGSREGVRDTVLVEQHATTAPASWPNLRGAACMRPGAADMTGRPVPARRVCSTCPLSVFERCREWVLTAEQPAGSLAGVYAGMSPEERIELRERRRVKA